MLVFLNDLQTGVCGATASGDAGQLWVLAETGTGGFSIEGQVLQTSKHNIQEQLQFVRCARYCARFISDLYASRERLGCAH